MKRIFDMCIKHSPHIKLVFPHKLTSRQTHQHFEYCNQLESCQKLLIHDNNIKSKHLLI
jgi:hypothetical protein